MTKSEKDVFVIRISGPGTRTQRVDVDSLISSLGFRKQKPMTTAIATPSTTPSKTRAAKLYIKALTDIPKDVRKALKRGHESEVSAGNKTASKVMLTVLENVKLADDKDMMVCQDTGLPIYKIRIGNTLVGARRAGT